MDFQTPAQICKYMVALLPDSIETVLEPTPGQGNLVKALKRKGYSVTAPKNFWKMERAKFDAAAMNPPFSPMEMGNRILFDVMEMADIVIAIMPWLTIINGDARTRKLQDFGIKSVTHLPRNVFRGSRVQTCILELSKNFSGRTRMEFFPKLPNYGEE